MTYQWLSLSLYTNICHRSCKLCFPPQIVSISWMFNDSLHLSWLSLYVLIWKENCLSRKCLTSTRHTFYLSYQNISLFTFSLFCRQFTVKIFVIPKNTRWEDSRNNTVNVLTSSNKVGGGSTQITINSVCCVFPKTYSINVTQEFLLM